MLKRRSVLGVAAGALLLAACQEQTQTPPKAPGNVGKGELAIPTDWNAQSMYEGFEKSGTGVEFASQNNRPKAFVAFDCQSPESMRLLEQAYPLRDKVNFVWLPVAVLNPYSEPQGAAILAAINRPEMLERQYKQFKNTPVQGIVTDTMVLPFDKREALWTNTRIFRLSGARDVPFGVMKTSQGEFRPITAAMTTADLEKLFGL